MSQSDSDALLPLVRAAVAGQGASWDELVRAIAPRVERLARAHRDMKARGLAARDDDVAEIVTATLERLARDGMRNLARFLAQLEAAAPSRPQSFDSWLYGAVDFAIREHVRRRYGRAPAPRVEGAALQPSKRELHTNAERFEHEPLDPAYVRALSVTKKLALAEIFAYIDSEFEASEARALRLYYGEERSFEEIAAALGLRDAKAADKLVRRLNARLRHHFADDERE